MRLHFIVWLSFTPTGKTLTDLLHGKRQESFFISIMRIFFSGDSPLAELINVPYEGYTMPTLRFNPEKSKGVIVMHGGFDSS